jgi:hypothetical protein
MSGTRRTKKVKIMNAKLAEVDTIAWWALFLIFLFWYGLNENIYCEAIIFLRALMHCLTCLTYGIKSSKFCATLKNLKVSSRFRMNSLLIE